MKIFNAEQIKRCDEFTVKSQSTTSIELMECAAVACAEWLLKNFDPEQKNYIFCGKGNNGGDGFAIARILYQKGRDVSIFIDGENAEYSDDAQVNFTRIKEFSGIDILDFQKAEVTNFDQEGVIIDALLGTGISREVEGHFAKLISFLNGLQLHKVSIDIPSGLFCDKICEENSVIFNADETLSFQFWKKTFLHPETGKFCGKINVQNIGLSDEFIRDEHSSEFIIDQEMIRKIYQPRNAFSHKGDFGKATVIGGSYGKIGAIVLSTKAALRTGSGLTYVLTPNCGYEIVQATCPEAMFISGGEKEISKIEAPEDARIGIGPGLGQNEETKNALIHFLKSQKNPLVMDADALNIISENPEFFQFIPQNSIITPHPKEFERLFGKSKNSFEQLEIAKKYASQLGIYIILKGHHTQIITPEKDVFYNTTGNAGMAKGGSGDVLLGIITSLLAQHYSALDACLFGVWLHGKAGDSAAEKFSQESMLPSDLVDELGSVFKSIT